MDHQGSPLFQVKKKFCVSQTKPIIGYIWPTRLCSPVCGTMYEKSTHTNRRKKVSHSLDHSQWLPWSREKKLALLKAWSR